MDWAKMMKIKKLKKSKRRRKRMIKLVKPMAPKRKKTKKEKIKIRRIKIQMKKATQTTKTVKRKNHKNHLWSKTKGKVNQIMKRRRLYSSNARRNTLISHRLSRSCSVPKKWRKCHQISSSKIKKSSLLTTNLRMGTTICWRSWSLCSRTCQRQSKWL